MPVVSVPELLPCLVCGSQRGAWSLDDWSAMVLEHPSARVREDAWAWLDRARPTSRDLIALCPRCVSWSVARGLHPL